MITLTLIIILIMILMFQCVIFLIFMIVFIMIMLSLIIVIKFIIMITKCCHDQTYYYQKYDHNDLRTVSKKLLSQIYLTATFLLDRLYRNREREGEEEGLCRFQKK